MTIWIDPPRWPGHGRLWSHLISDTSIAELHEFAAGIGIPRRGFEGDHYDIPAQRYAATLAAGAQAADSAQLVRMLQGSGLRLRKRKGEKGIAHLSGVSFPDGSVADVDLVLADREPPQIGIFASAVYLRDGAGHWLSVYSPRRGEWSAPSGWREPGESPTDTVVREVAEETGLMLDPASLRPVAYERFYPRPGAAWPVADGKFLAIYRADVPGVTPALTPEPGCPARWTSAAEFLAAARDSWWLPTAERILDQG